GAADASGDLERRLRQPVPKVGLNPAIPVSSLLDGRGSVSQSVTGAGVEAATEQMAQIDLPSSRPAAASAPPPATARQPHPEQSPAALRTQTSEAASATLIRQPPPPAGRTDHRPGRHAALRQGATAAPPRKRRRWIALVVLLGVLLIVAGLVSALVLGNRSPNAATPDPTTGTGGPSTPGATQPTVIPIRGAQDFDPQGDPDSENPQLVKLAHDGKPKTRWQTVTYFRNPELGGLKRGVGLVLDLGTAQPVGSVKVALSGNGTAVQIRVPKDDPASTTEPPMSSDNRWRTVSKDAKVKKTGTLALDKPVTTRFVLVYLTSLPKEGSGYKGGIYEVEVSS
ncbi:MAG: hypothetical protein ABWX96_12945, partial [Propionibacteriaceae bacterium]